MRQAVSRCWKWRVCWRLEEDRENKAYLPEVALPRELRVEPMSAGLSRADYVFLGVPSKGIAQVIENLHKSGLPARTPVISANSTDAITVFAEWRPPSRASTPRLSRS